MTNQNVKLASVIDNSGDNFIGSTDMKKNRSQALSVLKSAKEIEIERCANGWVWMHREKESKQVSPKNVKRLQDEGWRRIQSGRKQ